MPEPKSKAQIIQQLETERRRLERNLARLKPEDMERPGVVVRWSVKDVLAHLADWEEHMLLWTEDARRGDRVDTPEPGITWKQLDVLNQRIYEAHCRQSLEQVLEYFRAAHARFMTFVEAMPEDEMLAKSRYPFTGKASIYGWLRAYAAHDLWAKTKIRAWDKARHKMRKK